MENEQASCCGEEGSTSGCGCGTGGGRSWIKTVLFVAIIFAAIAVGVYSLWSQPGQPPAPPVNGVAKPAATAEAKDLKTKDCSKKCEGTSKSPCCGN